MLSSISWTHCALAETSGRPTCNVIGAAARFSPIPGSVPSDLAKFGALNHILLSFGSVLLT